MDCKSPFLLSIIEQMYTLRYAKKTIETYIYWIKYFIRFNNRQHPAQMGDKEVAQFLSYLSNQQQVATKTQAVALNALVFLKRKVIFHNKINIIRELILPPELSALSSTSVSGGFA